MNSCYEEHKNISKTTSINQYTQPGWYISSYYILHGNLISKYSYNILLHICDKAVSTVIKIINDGNQKRRNIIFVYLFVWVFCSFVCFLSAFFIYLFLQLNGTGATVRMLTGTHHKNKNKILRRKPMHAQWIYSGNHTLISYQPISFLQTK